MRSTGRTVHMQTIMAMAKYVPFLELNNGRQAAIGKQTIAAAVVAVAYVWFIAKTRGKIKQLLFICAKLFRCRVRLCCVLYALRCKLNVPTMHRFLEATLEYISHRPPSTHLLACI